MVWRGRKVKDEKLLLSFFFFEVPLTDGEAHFKAKFVTQWSSVTARRLLYVLWGRRWWNQIIKNPHQKKTKLKIEAHGECRNWRKRIKIVHVSLFFTINFPFHEATTFSSSCRLCFHHHHHFVLHNFSSSSSLCFFRPSLFLPSISLQFHIWKRSEELRRRITQQQRASHRVKRARNIQRHRPRWMV